MRAVDAAECYPFGGGSGREGEGEPPPPRFPPMDPTPRSRWWRHELAAGRARLSAGAEGGAAAAAGGSGGGMRKGSKRKGFRASAAGERARKRRRVLQFRSFLKNKEKTAKPESTSRLHEHKLHIALLTKHISSTARTRTELLPRKQLEEACDRMPTHENSMNKRSRERMDPSSETHSNLFGRREMNSSVNKQVIEVSRSTNFPTNTGCEVLKPSAGPKDDIFGDLPLLELEGSKITFRTGVDELPTVIEESFITNQSEADSIPEAVPLKLIDASDITAQTPSPLEDDEPACISRNIASGSHPYTDGLPNNKTINMVKPGPGDMQLKFTGTSALSSHSELRSKCGSSNPLQGCFDANKNCSEEIEKHGLNSTVGPPAMRTRTEATKCLNASVNVKKTTDISNAVVALPVPTNHLSYQGSALPSAAGVFNTRINANDMSPFRSMPAKECIPANRSSGNFRSNVCHESRKHMDPCAPLLTDYQGSWHSKLHPICSPANIGMAFMKLPGLERMEISNCSVKINENKFCNAQSMNTVKYQKQQLASGMTNMMLGTKKIVPSDSQAGKTVLDNCVGQGDHHLQQPTVRLMGKTVSVCKHSKDHNVSTLGKVSPDNVTIEANHLSTISCQLPQKISLPCQDSVISRMHLNDSSDFLARVPNNSLSGQNTTFSGLHNQRPQPIDSASTAKDCTWNFGGQVVHQAKLNKTSMISTNSKTRHLELRQPPNLISIPQNQQSNFSTPASHMSRNHHSFVGPILNQSSPVSQSLIKDSMKERYQKSTFLSYDDPSSVPICQPYQIPGAKSSSASVISFFDLGLNDSLSRSSSPGLSLSLTTGLANDSVSTGRPTCVSSLMDAVGSKNAIASFADPVSNRPAYADNVSQQPAKRQLVTDRHDSMSMGPNIVNRSPGWLQQPAKRQHVTDREDFMSLGPNIANHSPGWSLSDAVGPQVLDFSKRLARDGVQTSRNESNNSRTSSGPVPPIETISSAGVVAGANTMLKPVESKRRNNQVSSLTCSSGVSQYSNNQAQESFIAVTKLPVSPFCLPSV
ncbi:hypothetical protein U9M48_017834 [Paspalum notatum var. saurae]|uniref:HVA22-like protein f n=1 Tax=Paspalum notatum var. saurae TaxID=547442 RepID=A0AAQ3T8M2_PASNO